MALTHPSWTVDTTFSSKNIATAASVYTFTAAADAKVQITVKLTNAAGNGDYVVYLTHQWLGTGTASVVLPKATCPAASGETVIEFVSMELSVKATDVVNVMIDGLAGDTSVNGAIRISADNPSVFDQANDVPAVNVTYWAGGALPALALESTAQAILEDTGTTLPAQIATITGGAGSGSTAYSNTVTDVSSAPLDGVEVWITSDSGGASTLASTTTDTLGGFTVWLDPGTYYLWLAKGGYNFGNPTTITVT